MTYSAQARPRHEKQRTQSRKLMRRMFAAEHEQGCTVLQKMSYSMLAIDRAGSLEHLYHFERSQGIRPKVQDYVGCDLDRLVPTAAWQDGENKQYKSNKVVEGVECRDRNFVSRYRLFYGTAHSVGVSSGDRLRCHISTSASQSSEEQTRTHTNNTAINAW